MSTKFTIDTSKFDKTFFPLTLKKYPVATQKGIMAALIQLKQDADNIPPKTPHKDGGLKAQTKIRSRIKTNAIDGDLTFEQAYAAFQHLGMRADGSHVIKNWTGGGNRAGFVSKKIARFSNKYMNIIVLKIKSIQGF